MCYNIVVPVHLWTLPYSRVEVHREFTMQQTLQQVQYI